MQIGVLGVLLAGATALTAQIAPVRSVYINAFDDKGQPLDALMPQDLAVKEDGKARPVVNVAPASEKLSVAMLVDDGGVGINDFRLGIANFINRLLPKGEFSLTGIAEQNRLLADYTQDNVALANGIRSILVHNVNGGGHLVEAVRDTATVMAKREVRRPVIVILTNQASEYGDMPASRAMDEVSRVRAAIYVVEVLRTSGRSGSPTEAYDAVAGAAQDNEQASADRARNAILGDGPKQTGGRRVEVSATADAPKALLGIADELFNQLVLSYESSAKPGAQAKIEVKAARAGIRILAPARTTNLVAR